MLNDFFRINMPYGLSTNIRGEIMVFNREYMPLGWNDISRHEKHYPFYTSVPVYSKYIGLTDKILSNLAVDSDEIVYHPDGKVRMFWLYSDKSNPRDRTELRPWDDYFLKLKILSRFKLDVRYHKDQDENFQTM